MNYFRMIAGTALVIASAKMSVAASLVCPTVSEKRLNLSIALQETVSDPKLVDDFKVKMYSCDPSCVLCDSCISFRYDRNTRYFKVRFIHHDIVQISEIKEINVFGQCSGYNFVSVPELNSLPLVPR